MATREHLFRGKCGEIWEYGDRGHGANGTEYICVNINTMPYQVDPETVCEFTGLTDKNGVKIFEGDIVEDVGLGRKAVIKWLDKYSCFAKTYAKPQGEVFEYMNVFADYTEVIGNIFDNPELLKN